MSGLLHLPPNGIKTAIEPGKRTMAMHEIQPSRTNQRQSRSTYPLPRYWAFAVFAVLSVTRSATANGWQVVGGPAASTPFGPNTSVVTDSLGRAHLAYSDNVCVLGGRCLANSLAVRYGRLENGKWAVEIVDASSHVLRPSIAVDTNGTPHVAYVDSANQTVKYAYRSCSGISVCAWRVEVIGSMAWGDKVPIAVTNDYTPQVVYRSADGVIHARRQCVAKLGMPPSCFWMKTVVYGRTSRDEVALAVDSANVAHVAFGDSRLWYLPSYGTLTTLAETYVMYCRLAVTGPQCEKADGFSGFAEIQSVSIALDARTVPHIAFSKDRDAGNGLPDSVRYAVKPLGGVWSVRAVDHVKDLTEVALAVTPLGQPQLAYYAPAGVGLLELRFAIDLGSSELGIGSWYSAPVAFVHDGPDVRWQVSMANGSSPVISYADCVHRAVDDTDTENWSLFVAFRYPWWDAVVIR